MKDIVPELLDKIRTDFEKLISEDVLIQKIDKLIKTGTATYKDANEYAVSAGRLLSAAISKHISAEAMPEGRMYFNIADRILGETLSDNYKLVSAAAEEVQSALNANAGIGIKSVKPKLNTDRIKGLVDKISNETDFEKVAWLLGEPVVNFSQSVVDDSIKANAEFHYKSGLNAKIVRTPEFSACEWCREIAGTYAYPDVPEDVYRRHERCRCIVDYDPGTGKTQNVWSKRWT